MAPDETLIQRSLEAYHGACAQAGVEQQAVDIRRSRVRRRRWRGRYDWALVTLRQGARIVAIYEIYAELLHPWYEAEPRVEWDVRRVYTPELLHPFETLFADLDSWWQTRAREWRASGKGSGTFVGGAGIAVRILPPRCRKPQSKIVILPPYNEVGGASGCWEPFVDELLRRLAAHGVEANYNPGRMD